MDEQQHFCMSSVKTLIDKAIISKDIASRLCNSELALPHFTLAFQRGGEQGVQTLLKKKGAGRVRVTSTERMLKSIVSFTKENN